MVRHDQFQGLLSLDEMEMQIKARSGSVLEKQYAAKLIPIISRHHLLLVTLMLWNASATEALPIFLAELVPEYVAIIISVTLVLFVGEIIPASILTGPNQLKITASLTPLVYFVMAVFFPLAYPIGKALDHIIGHSDMTMYNRTEISTMMQLHLEEGVKRRNLPKGKGAKGHHPPSSAELYEAEEVNIIAGALKYRELSVSQVMTPAANVYMVSVADTLNYKLVYEIFKSGYSRIPVYEKDKDDVVGLILAKDLIFIDPEVRQHVVSKLFIPSLVGIVWCLGCYLCTQLHGAVRSQARGGVARQQAGRDPEHVPTGEIAHGRRARRGVRGRGEFPTIIFRKQFQK
jgi:metal transporter CNNM